jgi:KEOPS complex subunit Pcc1
MDHQAVLEFDYRSSSQAAIVERSVRLEAGDIEGDRTRATVDREGATLRVTVDAADLIALRAGCNTWLTLVDVAEECAGAQPAVS